MTSATNLWNGQCEKRCAEMVYSKDKRDRFLPQETVKTNKNQKRKKYQTYEYKDTTKGYRIIITPVFCDKILTDEQYVKLLSESAASAR